MTPLPERQRLILARHIAALRDDARAMDATAELFRPEFTACWEHRPDRSMGRMLDGERALQLRELVLNSEANAKYNRELADAIENLMSVRALSNGGR